MRERLADRPPRPLADAPTGPLTDGAEELARDWLVELLAQLPLERAPALDLEPLAGEGPEVCRVVIAALASDDALAALRPGGSQEALLVRVGRAGAGGRDADAPAAVESLRRVLWAAARAQLEARPSVDLVAALSDRLAHVCATVTATILGAAAGVGSVAVATDVAEPEPALDSAATAESVTTWAAPPDAPEAPPVSTGPDLLDFVVRDARGEGRDGRPRRGDWDAELLDALGAEPARSLLLVDVDGHERVLAADGRAALQRAERALVRTLVDDATMVCERLGRYWIVSGCTNEEDASGFARRLAEAVAAESEHLGVALTASIGLTLLGAAEVETAREGAAAADAARICERAEEAMLSARAAGVGVDSR